jgi:hypothetical protein
MHEMYSFRQGKTGAGGVPRPGILHLLFSRGTASNRAVFIQ